MTSSTGGGVRIGTRGSDFALRQARGVQAELLARGVESTIITYRTSGDKHLDEPLSAADANGMFTREIERALLRKKIDVAVHSLDELPTTPTDGLEIAAVLARGDSRDALVVSGDMLAQSIDDLPSGSRVATSSVRRRAQLLAARPDLEVAELRGDVPTRLQKVDAGRVHAAIFSANALHVLGAHQHITSYLAAPEWLPAAGQAVIALQVRTGDASTIAIVRPLHHVATWQQSSAERAFLSALEGGVQVPIGALVIDDVLHGFIADVSGQRMVRGSIAFDAAECELSGIRLANQLRSEGATEILEAVRRANQVPRPQPE